MLSRSCVSCIIHFLSYYLTFPILSLSLNVVYPNPQTIHFPFFILILIILNSPFIRYHFLPSQI